MAKNKTMMFGGIAILVVMLAVFGYLFVNQQLGATADVPAGSYISVPTYGYIECIAAKTGAVVVPPGAMQLFDATTINCQLGGDTLVQSCVATLKQPSCSECSGISVEECGMIWTKCTAPNECKLTQGSTANDIHYLKNAWICSSSEENKEYTVPLGINQFIYAEFHKGFIWSSNLAKVGRYQVQLTPYFLYRHDIFSEQNGAVIPNSRDCAYGGTLTELNLAIENVKGGGALSTGANALPTSTQISQAYLRAQGARISYLSNFVAIPPQYSIFNENAYQAYCYDKKVYKVEEVVTPGGSYKVANTGTNAQIRTVDCCNKGDCAPNEYCKLDSLTCEPMGQNIQCDNAFLKCPVVGFQPTADRKVIWQECVNSVCVNKEKVVKCNFPSDCPGGYCDVDAANPSNNECKYIVPKDFCGNGVCEASYGENVQMCPEDCNPGGNEGSFLWWIIGGIVVLLVIIAIIMSKKGGKTTF